MASTSFLGEDQTDEDFFDKLVDNEFEVSDYGQNFVDGADADEVNASSNTSVSEVGTATANHSGDGGNNKCDEQVKGLTSSDAAAEKETLVSGENVSIGSSESVILHEAVEANNDIIRNDFISDNAMSKTSEPKNAGVKEVGWSAFGPADDSENNGGRSYADYFTELEDNSEDPFAKVGDAPMPTLSSAQNVVADLTTSVTSAQHQAGQVYGAESNQVADEQNWENLYPGWRYDHNTGQWHQVDNVDASANSYQESSQGTAQAIGGSDQRSEVSYMQQTAQSAMGTVTDDCTTSSVVSWNQVSHGSNTQYPPNMVFDPQYPGWYYDTITQQWHLLESYIPDAPPSNVAHDQNIQNGNASTSGLYGEYGQVKSGYGSQSQSGNWAGAGAGVGTGAASNYSQPNVNMWQPEMVSKNDTLTGFHTASHNQENHYGSRSSVNNYTDQQMSTSMGTVSNYADQQMGKGSVSSFTNQQMDTSMGYGNTYPDQQMGPSVGATNEKRNYGYDSGSRISGFQSFVPASSVSQQFNQTKVDQAHQMQFSNSFQNGSHFSSNASETRSSAGRPPHALVSFGFGGKLIVMKDASSFVSNTVYGSQENSGSSVSIINMMDIVVDNNDATSTSVDYFRTLCHQSFPGPLVGGNIGSKELNKWIDERILSCDSANMEYTKGELLRLLLSLLKIACQHYGKLRSPFGTDPALKESDSPESAVAKLFASSKKNGSQMSGFGAVTHCLQNMPSEGQIRATAAEVQNLLVAGRTKEALQCAQEGQLWGPALVLAAQLGNQFHVETVRQMAHRQLIAGSPLRTLCLLISGQPADVFSADNTSIGGLPDAANMYQQPAQIGANCMLNDWEQNLAIITANRTKDDELVIIHLGDCLWKEKGEVTAAHICYLVAEANFESYSDTARMCLIGADHWSFPRTYVSPEAIQRTELYEYAKVLGNSQSVLLPFQPYKIIYAYMLAELGKISDSLKYCQAILKSLKTGRAPEVDAWKQLTSSLEERIRTHQQGGYGANLAPAKLVGKLLPFIDRSIHRMIGASSPQTTLQNGIQSNENDNRPMAPRVPNSQSTMAMSSLMPPESTETMGGWTGGSNRMSMHSRSISEPDFGRSPRQVDPATGASPDGQGKASISGGPSRFGRFGSQIFKTIGWVARRSDRQAKLGEKNKFYYDEKLKQWIEEGAAPPVQEATPPPPPTTSFQNGTSDYSLQNAFKNESMPANGGSSEIRSLSPSRSSGMPPIPPTSNHFSARARMGVRSRYVDTFNKSGGTPVNLFQSNSAAAPKPAVGANAKFFIPTPPSSCDQTSDANHATEERMQEATAPNVDQRAAMEKDSSPPTMVSSGIQRYPSMNSITPRGSNTMENGSLSSRSRRTASWSGSVNDAFNPAKMREVQPLGEALGMPPSSFMVRDDLHEVEL